MFINKSNPVTRIGAALFALVLLAAVPAGAMEGESMSHDDGMMKEEGGC